MDELEHRVFQLVAEYSGTALEKLALQATLREDIGMDGDDAVDFFEAFSREFRVSLEELKQVWDSYFMPEGLFSGVPFGPDRDITIRRLVEAARLGRWPE